MEEILFSLFIGLIIHAIGMFLIFPIISDLDQKIDYSKREKTRIVKPTWFKLLIFQWNNMEKGKFTPYMPDYRVQKKTKNQVNKLTFVFSFVAWIIALSTPVLMLALVFVHKILPLALSCVSWIYMLMLSFFLFIYRK